MSSKNQERDSRILDMWVAETSAADIAAAVGLKTASISNIVLTARARGDKRAIARKGLSRIAVQNPRLRLADKIPGEVREIILNLWDKGVKTSPILSDLASRGRAIPYRAVNDVIEAARLAGDRRAHLRSGKAGDYARRLSLVAAAGADDLSAPSAPPPPLLCPELGIEITYREIISVDAMTHAGSEKVRVRIALPRLRFLED